MEKLTTLSLQKELNEFGETHSKKYARDILTLIKTSLRDAYLDGIIKRDIFTRLQPAGQVVDKGDNFLNATDFTKLQDFLYSKTNEMQARPFYLMALVALETGARLGEVQALTKKDITDNHITINKAYSSSTHKVTDPKTKSSVRTIAISKRLSAVLSNFFKTTGQDNLIENKMNTARVSLEMQDLVREADIQPIHFHGLRHSHVSYLLHNGVDIDYVSKRVGHANVSVTLQIYAHMLKEKELAQDELTLHVLDNE
ncbi:site-specific integrase [Weissella cibaria]|nr:site-specific integrase [Weissella cibaria]